jgi:hypothetical protein
MTDDLCPVISWVQLNNWTHSDDLFLTLVSWPQWLPTIAKKEHFISMTARPWQNLFLDMQYQTFHIRNLHVNYIARSPSQDKPALLPDSLLFTTKVFRISSYNIPKTIPTNWNMQWEKGHKTEQKVSVLTTSEFYYNFSEHVEPNHMQIIDIPSIIVILLL